MRYHIGDLIIWKNDEELSTITGYWIDYDNRVYYEIETYNTQYKAYHIECIGEERIKILVEFGSIMHYPILK